MREEGELRPLCLATALYMLCMHGYTLGYYRNSRERNGVSSKSVSGLWDTCAPPVFYNFFQKMMFLMSHYLQFYE